MENVPTVVYTLYGDLSSAERLNYGVERILKHIYERQFAITDLTLTAEEKRHELNDLTARTPRSARINELDRIINGIDATKLELRLDERETYEITVRSETDKKLLEHAIFSHARAYFDHKLRRSEMSTNMKYAGKVGLLSALVMLGTGYATESSLLGIGAGLAVAYILNRSEKKIFKHDSAITGPLEKRLQSILENIKITVRDQGIYERAYEPGKRDLPGFFRKIINYPKTLALALITGMVAGGGGALYYFYNGFVQETEFWYEVTGKLFPNLLFFTIGCGIALGVAAAGLLQMIDATSEYRAEEKGNLWSKGNLFASLKYPSGVQTWIRP